MVFFGAKTSTDLSVECSLQSDKILIYPYLRKSPIFPEEMQIKTDPLVEATARKLEVTHINIL